MNENFRPAPIYELECSIHLETQVGSEMTQLFAATGPHKTEVAAYALPRESLADDAALDLMGFVMECAQDVRNYFWVESPLENDLAASIVFALGLLFGDETSCVPGRLGHETHGQLRRAYDRWKSAEFKRLRAAGTLQVSVQGSDQGSDQENADDSKQGE